MKDIKRFSTINDGFISSQLVSCISNIVYLNSFTRVNTLQCTYTGLCKRMMLNNNDRKFILKISPHMFQLTSADLRHGLIQAEQLSADHTIFSVLQTEYHIVFIVCGLTKDTVCGEAAAVFWRCITAGINEGYAISLLTYAHGLYWFIYLLSQADSSLIHIQHFDCRNISLCSK